MRYATCSLIALTFLIATVIGQTQANSPELANGASTQDADSHVIQEIEVDWLKAEKTTDPTLVEKVLADDYVNLTPTGIGPGKAALLKKFRENAGEAPPYSVRQQDMHIFVLNDMAAVASYVTIYVSNENKNVARQDTTHVFTKEHGTWKLRVSRSSNSAQGN
jgi:ketosteroid isomerase-like protein